ncbi:unnamed protein product [Leptidea sinapis]|uniref:Thioredoxin domain-containing protein n=1 Tax=Leptidea sinapis TaxID=189913 RepID=A0A5E4PUK2_9NEOP|nr:unnamed protein product [Leptidea sinapis]
MLRMFSKVHTLKLILFLSYLILKLPETLAEGFVFNYNAEKFKEQIKEMDGNFIMFYAPWSRHYVEFEPRWKDLAKFMNVNESKLAIAQIDCTVNMKLCHECDITGYPTLVYYRKNSFTPTVYNGTRDLPSLTMFLSEIISIKDTNPENSDDTANVLTYAGMAYLNDKNFEKSIATGQHFIMFFAPWCSASQRLAPEWSELGIFYARNDDIQIGQVNCLLSAATCKKLGIKDYPKLLWIQNRTLIRNAIGLETMDELSNYVEKMLVSDKHDPVKFMKKEKVLPVARITEDTFETFLEKDLVFINYFAPWCAHCMQLNYLWRHLGVRFQDESRVLIADVNCVHSKTLCETEKVRSTEYIIIRIYLFVRLNNGKYVSNS